MPENSARRLILLLIVAAVAFLGACTPGPPPSPENDPDAPQLTDEIIAERLAGAWVRPVPDADGKGEPITWTFSGDETRAMTIVEKTFEGNRATVVVDMKTGTRPQSRTPRVLEGRIKTVWELKTGWMLRRWEVDEVENVSMTYRLLPKPSPTPEPKVKPS